MEVVDTTQINTFGLSPKADFVPTAEEPIFVLTRSQLKTIIQEATAPILQEIQDLKECISSLEARQDQAYERFSGDVCDHGHKG
jgi:hypothetical protein